VARNPNSSGDRIENRTLGDTRFSRGEGHSSLANEQIQCDYDLSCVTSLNSDSECLLNNARKTIPEFGC